jgi:deoxyribose-phosphate aldolase
MSEAYDARLAAMIDHTLLKPEASDDDVRKLCADAAQYRFATVCVHPSMVPVAVRCRELEGIPVCTVIGFPLGTGTTETKVFEARQAFDLGAKEFDMVIHVGRLKSGDHRYAEEDIRRVARAVKECGGGTILKVILETSLLTDDEKSIACRLAKDAGADFVKTSTGFSSGGATERDVALMRSVVGPELGVKASGGIRARETALAMVRSGANRIGASASVRLVMLDIKEEE